MNAGAAPRRIAKRRNQSGRGDAGRIVIHDLAIALGQAQSLDEAIRLSLAAARGVGKVDCIGVYLAAESTGDLYLASHQGFPESLAMASSFFTADSPHVRALVLGQTLHGPYKMLLPTADRYGAQECPAVLLAVPSRVAGRLTGAIHAAIWNKDGFSRDQVQSLETIAALLGTAVLHFRNLSELTQIRSNISSLIHGIGDYLLILSMDGHIIGCNPAITDALGYTAEELTGVDVMDLHPPEMRAEARRTMEDLITGVSQFCRAPIVTRDGRLIPVESRVVKGRWFDGDVLIGISRDITERLQAEAALTESEQRFRLMFHQSPIGVTMIDLDFRILRVNPVLCEITGYEEGFLIDRDVGGLIHPLDRDTLEEQVRNLSVSGSSRFQSEIRLIHRRGATLWAHLSLGLVRDADGRPLWYLAMIQDITDRKSMEASRRQSENKYRVLFETVGDGLFLVDLATARIIDLNRAAAVMHGYEPEELIGKPLSELFAEPNQLQERIQSGVPPASTHWHRTKDGRRFPVEISINPLLLGGRDFLIASVRDHSEHHRAEEELEKHRHRLEELVRERNEELLAANQELRREIDDRLKIQAALLESEATLRAILSGPTDSAALLDSEGRIMDLNTTAADTLGHPMERMIGRSILDFMPGNAHDRARHLFDDVRSSGIPARFEQKYEGRWYDVVINPIRDSLDRVVRMAVVSRDITDKKMFEAEAIRAGQLATIGELAAGVAHEINNPINGIINCAQLLIDSPDDRNSDGEVLQRILKAGDRIASIVRNLLAYAHEQDGEKELVDVITALTDSVDLTGSQLLKDGIRLKMAIAGNLPSILGHAQRLQQVLLNILSNSRYALNRKYPGSHPDKILRITAQTREEYERRYIDLRIRDHGIGIPPGLIDRVCDPFVSTKPSGEGTGLGLSISQGIVKDFGGHLSLESEEGEFTEVRLLLPIEREPL